MSAAKLGTPGTRKSSRKEPNAQPKTGSYEQQDFVKRKECIIGGCIYNDPIGNATAGVPELLLWPTNDNDPYDRCLFHRLLVRTKKVTTQRWYREAKNFAKKDKLDRIEDALVKEWLHILNRFLIEDHVLPSLEQYLDEWAKKYALELVVAGPAGVPALPAPPSEGWDSITAMQPEQGDTRLEPHPIDFNGSLTQPTGPHLKPEATSKAADIDNDQQQQHAMAPSLKRGGPASDRKDDEVAIKTHVLQSHDAIANKAAERQRSASNAPMTAAELRLRLDILQERRKHFRNEASGYEHDIAEIDMLEETPAQNEAIENLKAASRPAFETTGIMVRWNGELDNQMKALVAGQTDQRDSSTRMGWSYAQEHLVSKPSFDPEQASRSKGKARVHTTDDSDEELSSLEDDQK